MLNNGHLSGGIGTPEGGPQSGGHPMYGGPHPGGGGPGDYNPSHSHNYLGPSPPSFMNGLGGGHHSGGFCSQMSLNQNPPPPNSRPLQCGGCRGPILDRYYLEALDMFWHNSCLKCNICNITLIDVGLSCFTREGMILCRADYTKIYRPRGACQGCGEGIPSDQLVMRAGNNSGGPGSNPPSVYHINCFSCYKCGTLLQKGDKYSLINGVLYCEQDVLKLMKNGIGSPSNANVAMTNGPAPRKGKVGRPRRSKD